MKLKEQLNISLVSYLNSLPYDYGLEPLIESGKVKIYRDHPSDCADRLSKQDLDLGLVPVVTLAKENGGFRFPGWGIGCTGNVASVCLLSNCDLDRVESVYLDPESRTSNMLVRIILQDYLGVEVNYQRTFDIHDRYNLGMNSAHLVIGDRALRDRASFKYCFDLGGLWHEWQKLPFVFAVWAGPASLTAGDIDALDHCFEHGQTCIPQIVNNLKDRYPYVDIADYLTNIIDHRLNEDHELGLSIFLQKVKSIKQEGILI